MTTLKKLLIFSNTCFLDLNSSSSSIRSEKLAKKTIKITFKRILQETGRYPVKISIKKLVSAGNHWMSFKEKFKNCKSLSSTNYDSILGLGWISFHYFSLESAMKLESSSLQGFFIEKNQKNNSKIERVAKSCIEEKQRFFIYIPCESKKMSHFIKEHVTAPHD